MSHDNHNQESHKRVYFGIPIAFALAFWFIVFLSLKACDGGHEGCCKEGGECSKECMEHCKAEGKDCVKKCEEGTDREVPKAANDEPASKEEEKGKEGENAHGTEQKASEQGNNATEGGKTGGTGEAGKQH